MALFWVLAFLSQEEKEEEVSERIAEVVVQKTLDLGGGER